MLWLNLPKPNLVTTPLLVLGAEDDVCFTQAEVRATAAAYHTEAELFPKMSHDMMLDPGWVNVAERIHAWLETRDPDRDSTAPPRLEWSASDRVRRPLRIACRGFHHRAASVRVIRAQCPPPSPSSGNPAC